MSNHAIFTVVVNDNEHLDMSNISRNRIECKYAVPYDDSADLHRKWQEARQVWDEFYVVVDADGYLLTSSHTYREEVLEREI